MQTSQSTLSAIERLICFASGNQLIEEMDIPFVRNGLLDLFRFSEPIQTPNDIEYLPFTASPMLNTLCEYALEKGMIGNTETEKQLFSAKIMGYVTPHPLVVREKFRALLKKQNGPVEALDWFYKMCRDVDYIKVEDIKRNIRFFEKTDAGELEITINLSKPEKDPREIAKLKEQKAVGYPLCMLCKENVGYAGRMDYPARQNHRMIPIELNNEKWFVQYSPYLYYDEHCIVLNSKHTPMQISGATFKKQFDFINQFPHYFIGSNADLPIVGGSILNHDHFQGGAYEFPMDKAKTVASFSSPDGDVEANILDWPMSCVQLIGEDERAICHWAETILVAWRGYSDEKRDIIDHTGDTPHNTITPILRKRGSAYKLNLVLRNNRTSEMHPLGIFHPHAPLHHIKKENIGLIEVMGLFILPGRLKDELEECIRFLTGERILNNMTTDDPCDKHREWLQRLRKKVDTKLSEKEARKLINHEVAVVCSEVLQDSGVFKKDADGRQGFEAFLKTVGFVNKD